MLSSPIRPSSAPSSCIYSLPTQYWDHLEPHTAGSYTNDIEIDHSTQAIRENFRHNHERLVQVKNAYDPTNLFRLNGNVAPTV